MTKRQHGPTAKPANELRSKRVVAHFTDDEFAELTALAGSDVPRVVARFVRDAALNRPSQVAPELFREVWGKLGPALANLNQMSKNLNSDKTIAHEDFMAILHMKNALIELRGNLV